MPPTSAAQVIKVLISEPTRVIRPSLRPSRWRIRLNTGCLAIAATRPLISPNTLIPIVPSTNTQMRAKPNIEPALAANTSSLMSTKPPTAVMMPSVSSSGFKAVLDLLELGSVGAQLFGRGIGRLPDERVNFLTVGRVGLAEARKRRLKLLPKPLVHAVDIGIGKLALPGLLVD